MGVLCGNVRCTGMGVRWVAPSACGARAPWTRGGAADSLVTRPACSAPQLAPLLTFCGLAHDVLEGEDASTEPYHRNLVRVDSHEATRASRQRPPELQQHQPGRTEALGQVVMVLGQL